MKVISYEKFHKKCYFENKIIYKKMKNSLTNREQTSVLSKNIIEFNKSTNNSKLPLNKAPKSNVKGKYTSFIIFVLFIWYNY